MKDDYDYDYDGPPPPAGGGSSKVLLLVLVICGLGGFCFCIPTIAAIAIPKFIEARKQGNEASAIGALRTLTTAQAIYVETNVGDDGKRCYGTLQQLGAKNLIDPVLASGIKQGYKFNCQPLEDPSKGYWVIARPAIPGKTGERYFYADPSGALYFSLKDSDEFDRKTGAPPKGWQRIGG